MALLDSIKDSDGKIKKPILISMVGAGGLLAYLFLKGGSASSTTSTGQSTPLTPDLTGLQTALQALASGSGGGGVSSGGGYSSGGGVVPTTGGIGGYTSGAVVSAPVGDSNVAPSVGQPFLSNPTNAASPTITPANSYPVAAATPVAVSKPSNSGLSSAPVVAIPYVAPLSFMAQRVAMQDAASASVAPTGPSVSIGGVISPTTQSGAGIAGVVPKGTASIYTQTGPSVSIAGVITPTTQSGAGQAGLLPKGGAPNVIKIAPAPIPTQTASNPVAVGGVSRAV